MIGKVYLIPTSLGNSGLSKVIPEQVLHLLDIINYYLVENERSARRFIVEAGRKDRLPEITFFVIDKHSDSINYQPILKLAAQGQDIGVMSEAGCPGIADPGSDFVALAHQYQLQVVPLVGPSSVLLAMMASGFNGQNFAFNGYLPVKNPDKAKKIKQLENMARTQKQSQIFIEAPYRNAQIFEELMLTCLPDTRLCIAADITLETELIKTKTIAQWKTSKPDLTKRPAIFIIG